MEQALASGDRGSARKGEAAWWRPACRSRPIDKIACERISEVVRGLKTFARVDSAELRKVNLNEQIQNTLKLTHGEFRAASR